jgi:hypothetical protein
MIFLSSIIFLISIFKVLSTQVDIWKDNFFLVDYSVDEKAGTITFKLDVATKGWFGVGFSNDGYMPNSDVIMCYIDSNGKPVVVDAFARSRNVPDADTSLGTTSDINNVSGSISNGRSVIQFSRKLDTGDKYDYIIKKDQSVQVIIAIRENGNPSTENGSWGIHTKGKVVSLVLYVSSSTQTNTSIDNAISTLYTDSIMLKYDKFQIPAKQTNYICQYFNVTSLLMAQKQVSTLPKLHAIKFQAVIDTKYIHHMVLFSCKPDVIIKEGNFACDYEMNKQCSSVIGVSGPTASDIDMPSEAGFLWGSEDTRVVYLQMHYENPSLLSNIVDSSGFKIYYTDKLRQYNMGVTILGYPMQSITLPPGQKSYEIRDTCKSPCTDNFGKNGIKIAFMALHGHELLKKIRVEMMLNGVNDTTTFRSDSYDFNIQYFNSLKNPIHLNPGDSLTTICEYDTTSKTNVTYGGESTNNEMCYGFMGYYPKENGHQWCMLGLCRPASMPFMLPTIDSGFVQLSFKIIFLFIFALIL